MNDPLLSNDAPALPEVETDDRFPTGPWLGFFSDGRLRAKAWMELELVFRHGRAAGAGRDRVGKFRLTGSYSVADGRCTLEKGYLGGHAVQYQGYNEGRGIWGGWSIPADHLHGGFHIWPKGMRGGAGDALDEALDLEHEDEAPMLVGAGMLGERDGEE